MKTNNKTVYSIKNAGELKNKVQQLELLRYEKEMQIKEDAFALLELAKPVNIAKRLVVKSALVKNTFTKKGITGNLLQIGMVYLLRRIFKNQK